VPVFADRIECTVALRAVIALLSHPVPSLPLRKPTLA
jgi:hypothetical protein